jgi:hypothetical protein
LENTWFPRVTVAPEAADDDGCAVDDPAAVAITLETSAVADAITVDVGLEAVDVAPEAVDAVFDVVDAGLDAADAPVPVPVV